LPIDSASPRAACSSAKPPGFGGPAWRSESCGPPGAAAARICDRHGDLELKVLLAHELAHLAARDPLWLAISDVLAGLAVVASGGVVGASASARHQ
jgi:hypothetical protein